MGRVIAKLVISDSDAYTTLHRKPNKYLGDPINVVDTLSEFGCDEILLVNISDEIPWKVLAGIGWTCSVPCTFGGGIRQFHEAERIISMGFEKLLFKFNSSSRKLIEEVALKYGSQAVSVSLEEFPISKNSYNSIIDCSDFIGEFVMNDRQADGTRKKSRLQISELRHLRKPTVLTGGVDSAFDILEAFEEGYDAVAIGTAFALLENGSPLVHIAGEIGSLMTCRS